MLRGSAWCIVGAERVYPLVDAKFWAWGGLGAGECARCPGERVLVDGGC